MDGFLLMPAFLLVLQSGWHGWFCWSDADLVLLPTAAYPFYQQGYKCAGLHRLYECAPGCSPASSLPAYAALSLRSWKCPADIKCRRDIPACYSSTRSSPVLLLCASRNALQFRKHNLPSHINCAISLYRCRIREATIVRHPATLLLHVVAFARLRGVTGSRFVLRVSFFFIRSFGDLHLECI